MFLCLFCFSLLTWKSEQQRRPSETQSHPSSDVVEHLPSKDDVCSLMSVIYVAVSYYMLQSYYINPKLYML